jgi:glycogen debranching enzyme
MPVPPPERGKGRNADWALLFNRDVISMPDKWEYPWYAAWDLAFQMIPMAMVDPEFAKNQLLLLLREWYMHPNGQLPAYEFALGDTNPPVHAWACWRVYKMTGPSGGRDVAFLEKAFHKLLINFTWWVNRKDPDGNNLFAGGFLGLDNIGAFDRGKTSEHGGRLVQADGTAWMAFYCTTMLAMALELAQTNPVYEDVASKFFEHFVAIADAMNHLGGAGLWDPEDGFYYDGLQTETGCDPLRVRSTVGLVPLLAVEPINRADLEHLPGFQRRLDWFLKHRADLADQISYMTRSEETCHLLLAVPSPERLQSVLRYLFDEGEFLSPHGIRSLSKYHLEHPYHFVNGSGRHTVRYTPGESMTALFGGNSNWRGPVWFPINFLIIEALERYHHFFGEEFLVEYPTGSGTRRTLQSAADDLSQRLIRLFMPDSESRRPCHGGNEMYAADPHFRGLPLFHEYFHGDTGRGCGASHQTGWTALVAKLIRDASAKQGG